MLKFVCFLFFKKCGIKDQIVPLKKARTDSRSFWVYAKENKVRHVSG